MKKADINTRSAIHPKSEINTKLEINHKNRKRNSETPKVELNIYNNDDSSTASSDHGPGHGQIEQEHARPRKVCRIEDSNTSDSSTNNGSKESINSSIGKFRNEFDEFKCKMRIFGESINLCKCMADDFRTKLNYMERRLQHLERKQIIVRSGSNYSAIIQKNKKLSTRTLNDAKKLQMCGTEEEMREVAAKICRNYLHGAWKTVETTSLEFRRISGGLSNFLYYVALPEEVGRISDVSMHGLAHSESRDHRSSLFRCGSFTMDEPRKVLLRIYGQVHGERAMDAIVTESVVFTLLSERRLGPKLFGVFSGGRIEEYIPARPLLTKELSEPALSMKIAEKMAAIHSMDVPLAKEPNWIWKTMGKWLKTVKDERLNMNGKNEQEQQIIKQLKAIDFDKEIEWLKKYIATVESPVTFCHNDMQEGNILLLEEEIIHATADEEPPIYVHTYDTQDKDHDHLHDMTTLDRRVSVANKETRINKFDREPILVSPRSIMRQDSISSNISDPGEPRLVLIDFEYCAYNYRGFDIANHFQEWAYDYTNPKHPNYYENQDDMPTLEQKEIFIKEYLKHYKSNQGEEKAPTIDDVNHLLNEVEAFAVASHLFWCLWSIVNASKSQIPFGYWEYALSRLEVYQRLKQQVIKKESYGIPQKRKICEVDI